MKFFLTLILSFVLIFSYTQDKVIDSFESDRVYLYRDINKDIRSSFPVNISIKVTSKQTLNFVNIINNISKDKVTLKIGTVISTRLLEDSSVGVSYNVTILEDSSLNILSVIYRKDGQCLTIGITNGQKLIIFVILNKKELGRKYEPYRIGI